MDDADGHAVVTVFRALVLARWIHFAAVFILFGSAFFRFHMGGGRWSADRGGLPWTLAATTWLIGVAAPVAALSGMAWLACILANMTDGFSSVLDSADWRLFFFQTQFGPVAIFRLALLAGGVLLVLLPWRNRAWRAAIAFVGALLLIDQAWLGHAAEGGAGLLGALMILSYCVHVLAAGAWIGGLPPLLFGLNETGRWPRREARDGALDLLSRFSLTGMIAVALIVATGVVNAGFRVGFTFDEFYGTDYGLVLAVKAGLVAAMLALAFFNRFVAMPRLSAASDEEAPRLSAASDEEAPRLSGASDEQSMAPLGWLRASIALELALGVLVLGVAAVLGVTPPPQ